MTRSSTPTSSIAIQVLTVDDHPAVLVGLQRVLHKEPDLAPVAALVEQSEIWDALDRAHVDVVVLDYDLARSNGLMVCLRIKQRADPPAVVIYTAFADRTLGLATRIAQADALVDKADPVERLLSTIRLTASGARALDRPSQELLEGARHRFEARDLPTLAMLIDGASLSEIAETLALTEPQAMRIAQRILGRLRANPRHSAT